MKIFLILKKTVFFFFAFSLFGCLLNSQPVGKKKVVAITQITSHASLDKVRQGVIQALKEEGFSKNNDTLILFENAQGNTSLAVQIAKKFISKKPDVVVAIGTPSAQAMHKAIGNTQIPLVFASITNPIEAGLVDDLEHPHTYTTGTRNVPMMKEQLTLIQTILPNIHTVGVILNYAEKNSVSALDILKKEAKPLGITVIEGAANSSVEVASTVQKLITKVDALLLFQDNTVASALPSILKISQEYKVPVFASYPEAVEQGALFGLAADEYSIGLQTGHMAAKILQGQHPYTIRVEDPKNIQLYINLDIANSLQISIPSDLIEKSIIFEKKNIN